MRIRGFEAGLVAVLLGGALTTACSGEDEVNLSDGCDILSRRCQEAVFEETAIVREQSGSSRPPVRTITLSEFADELGDALNADTELSAWDRAAQILGLLDPRTGVNEAAIEASLEGVAAFYDDGTQQVTIIDRGNTAATDPLDDVFILSHEFVHALQDETGHLGEFQEKWIESTDDSISTTTLIEGEAVVLAAGVVDGALRPAGRIDWGLLIDGLRSSVFDFIEESPEPFIAAAFQLPYALGAEALAPVWRAEGQSAIEALYDDPVLSLADWPGVVQERRPSSVEPLDCYPTTGPAGFEPLDHDTFGLAGVFGLQIDLGLFAADALRAGYHWANDSAVLFEATDSSDSYAVAWRVRWDDVTYAEQFETLLVEGLDTGAEILRFDREVLVFGATDPAALDSWADVDRCGTAAELPKRDDPASDSITAALRRSKLQ